MVIHDSSRLETLVEERQENEKEKECKSTLRLPVIAVQSIACAVIVLLALLFRMAGGEAYESLRQSFQQALARNEWVTALAVLWDGNPLDDADLAAKEDVKENSFTSDKSARLTDV